MLSSMAVIGAGDEYVLSFEDPQEYPESPDIDLKSMNSFVIGENVVVELRTYGDISCEPGNFYMISNTNLVNNEAWFYFCLSEGNGTFNYYYKEESVQLNDIWDISNDALTVRIPIKYAGSPENFNLTASATYSPPDSMTDFKTDYINMDESFYGEMSYNFDEAEPLGVPDSVRDHAHEGESQVYSLELKAGSGILIELNGSIGDWPYFTIFDSEQQYLTSSMPVGRNSRMTFIPKANGTYYIAIDGWSVSGSFRITTSLRGQSGEGYNRATPDSIPWQIGDEWTAGGYMSTEDLFAQLFAESGGYAALIPDFTAKGGMADFLIVTYAGEDGGNYRFDFKCRLYCDMTYNMTIQTPMYDLEDVSVDVPSTLYENLSGIADIIYNGSIWLGYYENGERGAYYGIERQTIWLSGSLDFLINVAYADFFPGMESSYYEMEMRTWGNISLELEMENSPGIPFLPAKDNDLSVDKKASTDYNGHIGVDIKMSYNSTEIDNYSLGSDEMNETINEDFNGSYAGYYLLAYDSGTKAADCVPAFTDPLSLLDFAMSQSYGYTDGVAVDEQYPYWIDYWTSKATYDPEGGFYSAFELPLSPFSDIAIQLEAIDSESSLLNSIGGMGLDLNMAIGDVSQDEAQEFFADPAGFMRAKEGGGSLGAGAVPFIIAFAVILIVVMVAVLVLAYRKINR